MSASKLLFSLGAFLLDTEVQKIQAKDIKLGLISDLHLKLDYDPTTSANDCTTSSKKNMKESLKFLQQDIKVSSDPQALLGRLGCDAPEALIKYMLELFQKQEAGEEVDAILLTGDMVGHNIAQDTSQNDPVLYQTLKDTHARVASLFNEYFPNTPVLITFGNNDCKYHDNAPHQSEKQDYYTFIYNLWFKNHPANVKLATDILQKTFMDGGYYRVDLSEKVSILSFNTLPYNKDQVSSEIGPEAENQFQWLEQNLKEGANTGRKFVIFSHIYAGARVKHDETQKMSDLWTDTYNTRYFDLLLQYPSQLIIEIAGHDHWEDLRSYENKDGQIYRNLFISTGISVDHFQLSGFSTMKIDETTQVPKELIETTVDITQAYGMDSLPKPDSLPKLIIDFQKEYGFKNFTAVGINDKIKNFESSNISNVLKYLSDKLGFDSSDPKKYDQGLQLAASWSLINKDYTKADNFFCESTRARTAKKLKECLAEQEEKRLNSLIAIQTPQLLTNLEQEVEKQLI